MLLCRIVAGVHDAILFTANTRTAIDGVWDTVNGLLGRLLGDDDTVERRARMTLARGLKELGTHTDRVADTLQRNMPNDGLEFRDVASAREALRTAGEARDRISRLRSSPEWGDIEQAIRVSGSGLAVFVSLRASVMSLLDAMSLFFGDAQAEIENWVDGLAVQESLDEDGDSPSVSLAEIKREFGIA